MKMKNIRITYKGFVSLPARIYHGNSHNIIVELVPTFEGSETSNEIHGIRILDNKGAELINCSFTGSIDNCFLQIELQAAALTIAGDQKQNQTLFSNKLSYSRNCTFNQSATHQIVFVVRLMTPGGEINVGTVTQTVSVVKFDGLNQRQVWIVAAATGIPGLVGTVYTVTQILLGFM